MTLPWYRRWPLAAVNAVLHLLIWLQGWIGGTEPHWVTSTPADEPSRVTTKIAAAFEDVAPLLTEVRRHMHNVKAAYPQAGGEELRRRALAILQQHGMAHRRAAFAIELVMQEWMDVT